MLNEVKHPKSRFFVSLRMTNCECHSKGAKLLKNLKQKKQPRVILNPPTADEESQKSEDDE